MNTLIKLLICACFAGTALAQSPYGDRFAAASPEKYLENAQNVKAGSVAFGAIAGSMGRKCMGLRDNVEVAFKAVPVDPNTKYTLSFRGSFSGGESIEENPRMEVTLLHEGFEHSKRYDFLPKMKLVFLGQDGKKISVKNHRSLPFRVWHDYSVTFYPPLEAVSMQLVISAGSSTTAFYLDDARFGKTPDQGALNVNPVTRESGLYDYSAWEFFSPGAGMILDVKGNAGFNTGYGSGGARFPMKEKTEYVIRPVKAEVLGYARAWQVKLRDKNGKEIGSISANERSDTKFTTPAGCVSGTFFMRSSVVEEIRILEAK